jgi:hypothetical protein
MRSKIARSGWLAERSRNLTVRSTSTVSLLRVANCIHTYGDMGLNAKVLRQPNEATQGFAPGFSRLSIFAVSSLLAAVGRR